MLRVKESECKLGNTHSPNAVSDKYSALYRKAPTVASSGHAHLEYLTKRFACWLKNSTDYILKYVFLIFPRKYTVDISCKLSHEETLCIKCQSQFSEKIREIVISLSSADFAQRVVTVHVKKNGRD